MDISDDFFKRHAHYIASAATFRAPPRAHDSSPMNARVARVGAEVALDARSRRSERAPERGDRELSDGVPTTDGDPGRESGRS